MGSQALEMQRSGLRFWFSRLLAGCTWTSRLAALLMYTASVNGGSNAFLLELFRWLNERMNFTGKAIISGYGMLLKINKIRLMKNTLY